MLLPYSSNVDFTPSLPQKSSLIFSLVAALALFALFRLVFVWVTYLFSTGDKRQTQSLPVDAPKPEDKSTKSWGLFTFESLPLSLTLPSRTTDGRGVGLRDNKSSMTSASAPSSPHLAPRVPTAVQLNWQSQRGGSVDGRPPPNPYHSQQPISMAKMIMSRHTFRKPAVQSPRRLPPSPVRQQSMV